MKIIRIADSIFGKPKRKIHKSGYFRQGHFPMQSFIMIGGYSACSFSVLRDAAVACFDDGRELQQQIFDAGYEAVLPDNPDGVLFVSVPGGGGVKVYCPITLLYNPSLTSLPDEVETFLKSVGVNLK